MLGQSWERCTQEYLPTLIKNIKWYQYKRSYSTWMRHCFIHRLNSFPKKRFFKTLLHLSTTLLSYIRYYGKLSKNKFQTVFRFISKISQLLLSPKHICLTLHDTILLKLQHIPGFFDIFKFFVKYRVLRYIHIEPGRDKKGTTEKEDPGLYQTYGLF